MIYLTQILNLYFNKFFFIYHKKHITFIKKIIYKTFINENIIKYIYKTFKCKITNIYNTKLKKNISTQHIIIKINTNKYIKNKVINKNLYQKKKINNNIIIININYEYNIKKKILIWNVHISLSIHFIYYIYKYINKLINLIKPNILRSYHHIIYYPYNILKKIFFLPKIISLRTNIHKIIKQQYDIYETTLYHENFFYTKIIKKIHTNTIFNWEYQYYKYNKLNLTWLNSYLNNYINKYY